MKLIVERSGGFAGMIRRGELDLSALSPEQQAALQKLLEGGLRLRCNLARTVSPFESRSKTSMEREA